jgi:hypothetical protein
MAAGCPQPSRRLDLTQPRTGPIAVVARLRISVMRTQRVWRSSGPTISSSVHRLGEAQAPPRGAARGTRGSAHWVTELVFVARALPDGSLSSAGSVELGLSRELTEQLEQRLAELPRRRGSASWYPAEVSVIARSTASAMGRCGTRSFARSSRPSRLLLAHPTIGSARSSWSSDSLSCISPVISS